MSPNQDLTLNPNQDLALNQDLAQDLTPNQINDISTRLRKAREFIQENSCEQRIIAARIYNLSESTLRSSISRGQHDHDGQNKILQEYQKNAIHQFIQSLLASHIQPTHQLIFNAICHLKHA